MAFDWRMLLSALSSAAPQLAQAKASRGQQEALSQGELEAAAAQQRADKALGDEVTKLQTSGPGAAQSESRVGYAQALKKARMQTAGPNFGSDRYQAGVKSAAAASDAYGARTGDFYSAIDAPGLQRQRENQGFGRAGAVAASAAHEADTAQYLARLRAQRIRPNPWAQLLGGIGQRIAQNYEPRGRGTIEPDKIYDSDYAPGRYEGMA